MTTAKHTPIDFTNVASTYSGKAGKCCCGCAGTHRYASAHRTIASAKRGYEVSDDEVSDRSVKRTVNTINSLLDNEDVEVMIESTFVSVETGTRLYVAYLLPATKES